MTIDRSTFAHFGEHSVFHEPVVSIVNPGGISIGTWTNIGAYAVMEALVPERGVTVDIGDNVYIGHFLRLTSINGVTIENEAMLADRVYISDTNHIYEDVTQPIKRQGLRDGRRVVIEEGAWLGIGSVVCGNVVIGKNAVVGANAVVRTDVAPRTVVSGNPAVVVRHHDGDTWRSAVQFGP